MGMAHLPRLLKTTWVRLRLPIAALLVALAQSAAGQPAPVVSPATSQPAPSLGPPLDPGLFEFSDASVKFNLQSLMNILRDRNHEGWVLAAYPDPNTGHPLIGAGFSLDVAATDHPQDDPLNPNRFLEPSSAQLWQAARLDPARLRRTLHDFNRDFEAWGTRGYRRRSGTTG